MTASERAILDDKREDEGKAPLFDGVRCPFCYCAAAAEFVDIGVGMQQVTPFACMHCDSREMDPRDDLTLATEEEKRCGWWRAP